jgi:hypothetical protein
MKPMTLLKHNGIFFTAAFIVWITIMIVRFANHAYFPEPLPNQVQQLQAQQAQQGQHEQNPDTQQ